MRAAHQLIGGHIANRILMRGAAQGAAHEPHRDDDQDDEDEEPSHGVIIIAKMKILVAVPGNLHTVRMNRFVPQALAELGHDVRVIDYSPSFVEKLRRKLAGRDAAGVVTGRLMKAIEEARPELFLTLYGVNVAQPVLAELRRRSVVTANWWLNDPFQWERAARILGDYDFAFTNARYSVDAYAAAGLKHVSFLPSACDPSIHRPLERASRGALSFAGDWGPQREEVLERLHAAGVEVDIHGPWRRKLRPGSPLRKRLHHGFFTPERMVEIFAEYGATLNIHTWRGRFDYGLNPRVFEAGACGAPQLVDHKRELDEIFTHEERAAFVVYRDDGELVSLARSLPTRNGELRAAARAAAASFGERHSYKARMRELLSVVSR